jgi:hypothetical protein
MATGRKTVVVGQVIDPVAWGNPLWDQSVQQFASDADRTAQFPVGQRRAGVVTWLDDVARLEVWNGTVWTPFTATSQHIPVAGNTDVNGTLNIAHSLGITPGQIIWNFTNGMDQATFLLMGPPLVFSLSPTLVQLRFTRTDTHGFLVSGPIKGTLTVLR